MAPVIRRLLAAALLLASICNALAGTGAAAPPSAAPGVVAASTYGSGHLGSWFTDAFGLPAFRYEVDESADPRARQPELACATDAQH